MMAFGGKRPGVGRDVTSLGGSKYLNKPELAGTRPGQGLSGDTIYGGIGGRMHTIYAGHGGGMNTIYGGVGGRMNTVTVTLPGGGRAETAFGGSPGVSGGKALTYIDPYRGAGNYVTVSKDGAAGAAVVTQKVIDPASREPVTVVYNRHTGLYLDRKLNRWIQAPPWLSAQIR